MVSLSKFGGFPPAPAPARFFDEKVLPKPFLQLGGNLPRKNVDVATCAETHYNAGDAVRMFRRARWLIASAPS